MNNDQKHVDKQHKLLAQDDTILVSNKQIITDFMKECQAQGLSLKRQLFYIGKLRFLAKGLSKQFSELSKEDIKDLLRDKVETKQYTKWTKIGHKSSIRAFFLSSFNLVIASSCNFLPLVMKQKRSLSTIDFLAYSINSFNSAIMKLLITLVLMNCLFVKSWLN